VRHKEFLIYLLCVFSFVEGGCLLTNEILISKIFAPFVGNSINTWTSILSNTLLGLALGYRLGGFYSTRMNKINILCLAYFFSGITILSATFFSENVLSLLLNFDARLAALTAGIVLLFPAIFFMAIISPIMVGIFRDKGFSSSQSTGLIYGISTLGGIVFLLFFIFVIVPQIGVNESIYVMAFLMILISVMLKFIKHNPQE
jgi:hypothetical protein